MAVSTVSSLPQSESATWLTSLGLSSYVAIDLETTGLEPDQDSIIEIGAVRFVNGKAAASFQSLIQPNRQLEPSVQERTGLPDKGLRDAPGFRDIADDFLKFVDQQPLVGHSSDFQLTFLRSAGQETAYRADEERSDPHANQSLLNPLPEDVGLSCSIVASAGSAASR